MQNSMAFCVRLIDKKISICYHLIVSVNGHGGYKFFSGGYVKNGKNSNYYRWLQGYWRRNGT